jgi:hypothetical protein
MRERVLAYTPGYRIELKRAFQLDRNKQVFVVKKQEKEELPVLDTFPEDNARQTDH